MSMNPISRPRSTTQRVQLRRAWSITLAMLAAMFLGSPNGSHAGDSVPDLRGQYEGYLFGPGANGLRPVSSSFLVQDTLRRFSGQVSAGGHSGGVNFSIEGTIAASGKCTCVGTQGSEFVYQARWLTFGGGAGALIGEAAFALGDGSVRGTLFQLRPFKVDPDDVRPDIRGEYAGAFEGFSGGVRGDLALGITDGTSNTLTLTVEFRAGPSTVEFAAVGDVDRDGNVAAVGVSADGNVLILKGIVSPRDPILIGTVSIQSAAGKVLNSGSIIAILIG